MNKLLRRQLAKHFSGKDGVPENLNRFLNEISGSYDHYDKDCNMTASSSLLRHRKMTAVNSRLKKDNKDLAKALNDITKIMDSSLDVICAVDEEGYFKKVSAACESTWGYRADELIGRAMIDFVCAEDHEKTKKAASNIIAGATTTNFENRYIHKDGSLVPINWSARWDAKDRMRYGVARDASEKKRSERIFEMERQRFNDLFFQAPSCIGVLKGPTHIFEMANPLYLQLIGKVDILGRSVKNVLPELIHQGFIELLDGVYETGKTYSANEMLIKLDRTGHGKLVDIYLNFIFQAYRNNEGSIEGIFFFAIDVTEQVLSRKKIEESEKNYSELIQSLPMAAYSCDAAGRILIYNKAAVALWGREPEPGKDLWCGSWKIYNVNGTPLPHDLCPMAMSLKDGRVVTGAEIMIERPNGDLRNVLPLSVPIIDSSGQLTGTVNVLTDITEKKHIEAVLLKRDSQLTLAAQMAGLGYWEFDIVNDKFTFTDQFYAIFKTNVEKVGAYTMSSADYARLFVHPDEREIIATSQKEAIDANDSSFSYKTEHRIIYETGETGWVSVHFYIVKDDRGRTVKTFGINQDITERKKVEETLRISEINLESKNKQLQQKNIELEQFVYIASHDLQEPLRTTSSFVKLLQEQYLGKFDQKADKYFTYILESSERMRELIKNLLEYSRIGNAKELEQVDCNKLLQNVLDDLTVAVNEAGACITSEALPLINGYATELKQLFQNLITNAIKFRKKETSPTINISVQRAGECWQFAFKDNGIGIEEKHNEKIFAIFKRLHTRTEYEGSGIGLSYCKKIVELHNGRIWVESKVGEGSTFCFTLPQNNNYEKEAAGHTINC